MTTTEVDNWPGDVEGLQGPDLMDRMRRHAERFNTRMVNDHIHTARLPQRPFVLEGDSARYTCDALIIATGAAAKYLGLPSEEAFKGKGVSACATCDGFFFRNQQCRRDRRRQHRRGRSAVPVEHRLARDAGTPARQAAQREDPAGPADGTRCGRQGRASAGTSEVDEIVGDDVRRAWPADPLHGWMARRHRDAAGHRRVHRHRPLRRTPGCSPGSSTCAGGYLVVHGGLEGNATATSVHGVFAAGDVADSVYRQAITSAGSGCMAALDADRYLESLEARQ